MTELVKTYIELHKKYNFDLPKEEEPELLKSLTEYENSMTVEELESLKSYVSAREFFVTILPLIRAKQAKA